MMHNPNLMYAIYPIQIDKQEVMETFFVNSLWKTTKFTRAVKTTIIQWMANRKSESVMQTPNKMRSNPDTIYARYNTEGR